MCLALCLVLVTLFFWFNCSYLLRLLWIFMHNSQVQEKPYFFISAIYIAFSDLSPFPRREFNFRCILSASKPSKGVKSLCTF